MNLFFGIILSLFCITMFIGLALLFSIPVLTATSSGIYITWEGLRRVLSKRVKAMLSFLLNPESRRIILKVPVIIETELREKFFAQTFDLSQSGFFVNLLNDRISIGSIATIRFAIGKHHIVSCKAKVVRKNMRRTGLYPVGCGLELTDLNEQDKKLLAKTLDREEQMTRLKEIRERAWPL